MFCPIGRVYNPKHITCYSCQKQGGGCQKPSAVSSGTGKMGNKKITIDGQTFDSKREYNRWCQLKMLESKGSIQELKRQVRYELAPAVKIKGKTKPALRYFADFVYQENGQEIVEDAKGHLTDVFKIKRHLMMTVHRIEIKET